MSIDQITAGAMALPREDRVTLAYALLDSADDEEIDLDPVFQRELQRRIEEMDSGAVQGIPHEEVMREARRIVDAID